MKAGVLTHSIQPKTKYLELMDKSYYLMLFISRYELGEQISLQNIVMCIPTINDKIHCQTAKFAGKLHFLGIRKVLNLGLKAERPLQNENHTEDWALGSHPRDNGHATH